MGFSRRRPKTRPSRRDELLALFVIVAALLALLSLHLPGPGMVGEFIRNVLRSLLGWVADLPPILASGTAFYIVLRGKPRRLWGRTVALGAFVAAVAGIVQTAALSPENDQPGFDNSLRGAGGLVGSSVASLIAQGFGAPGAYVLLVGAVLVALRLGADIPVLAGLVWCVTSAARLLVASLRITLSLSLSVARGGAFAAVAAARAFAGGWAFVFRAGPGGPAGLGPKLDDLRQQAAGGIRSLRHFGWPPKDGSSNSAGDSGETAAVPAGPRRDVPKVRNQRPFEEPASGAGSRGTCSRHILPEDDAPQTIPGSRAAGGLPEPAAVHSPETGTGAQDPGPAETLTYPPLHHRYRLPPQTLFRRPAPARRTRLRESPDQTKTLEETLQSFGIQAKVVEVSRGPVVTRYELQPAPGIKVSRIVSLADDLALNLAATDVRIEAPVPGKAVIGIEVPNKEIATVYLSEVLESEEFQKSSGRLTVALGKDIAGKPVVAELSKLIHLLIAGATGSGKSVCLAAIISSLLFRARPHELKLLMIDPKRVELTVYDGIPHLLSRVVVDPRKAAAALRWVVREMENRYQLFAAKGARNIEGYNYASPRRPDGSSGAGATPSQSPRTSEGDPASLAGLPGIPAADPGGAQTAKPAGHLPVGIAGVSGDGSSGSGEDTEARGPEELPEFLPYIVVIIDELADLMLVAAAEVEDSICRLAQMARAAGIFLVVATQRPSTDVITGLIKANIPSRLSFAVSSHIDSRTILDMVGAERLLGRGDMLFHPVGASKPIRAQGALVFERDVEELVRFWKDQGAPEYRQDVASEDLKLHSDTGADDELLPDAVQLVLDTGQASISLLQRRFRVGYSRAARLIDMMELKGIVGPYQGSKPREVLRGKKEAMELVRPRQ